MGKPLDQRIEDFILAGTIRDRLERVHSAVVKYGVIRAAGEYNTRAGLAAQTDLYLSIDLYYEALMLLKNQEKKRENKKLKRPLTKGKQKH